MSSFEHSQPANTNCPTAQHAGVHTGRCGCQRAIGGSVGELWKSGYGSWLWQLATRCMHVTAIALYIHTYVRHFTFYAPTHGYTLGLCIDFMLVF
jgi:hypothetical protein